MRLGDLGSYVQLIEKLKSLPTGTAVARLLGRPRTDTG